MSNSFIPALTGLRFFAAYWVLGYHFFHFKKPLLILNEFFSRGNLGVPFFFILSGFVISMNYHDKQISYRGFLRKRLIRIAPLYYLALVAAIPLLFYCYHQANTLFDFLALIFVNLFMLQGLLPIPDYTNGWNTPGWSISIELIFYLIYPLFKNRRLGPFQNHFFNMIFLFIIAILLNFIKPLLPESINLNGKDIPFIFTTLACFRMISFFIGMNLYLIFLEIKKLQSFKIGKRLDSCLALSLQLLLSTIWMIPRSKLNGEHPLILALFSIYILYSAYSPAINHFFNRRHWLLLGNASYAMYILQAPFRYYCNMIFHQIIKLPSSRGLYYIVFLSIMSITVSIVIYLFIEKPFKEYLHQIGKKGAYTEE